MTGRRFAFTVRFAAGKQRHRLDRRHARMYTPTETLRAERALAAACRAALAEALPACCWLRARYAPVVGAALCVLADTAGVDLFAAELGESLTKGMNGGTDLC